MSRLSARADAFVSEHRTAATALGERLADVIDQPDAFLATLAAGLEGLAEPAYLAGVTRACPQTPARYAVRGALADAILRPVRRALRDGSSVSALLLAQRLAAAGHRDLRLYALEPLRRSLPVDPELSWQVLRRLGRSAQDWIATDGLADLWARGVLAEPFRWAELEQLLYSQQPYERRLVAATLATMPHRLPTARRDELRAAASGRAFDLLGQLMGDDEVTVQKALSWALREWTPVDPEGAAAFLRRQAELAAETHDGARAWVVRDSLAKLPATLADELRSSLEGIRRDPSRPSTSIAARHAAAFAVPLAHSDQAVALQGDRYTRRSA